MQFYFACTDKADCCAFCNIKKFQLLLYIYDMISGMSRADVKNVLHFYLHNFFIMVSLFIIVADEVDSELLAKVLANPEMWAFLNSLAKTMK